MCPYITLSAEKLMYLSFIVGMEGKKKKVLIITLYFKFNILLESYLLFWKNSISDMVPKKKKSLRPNYMKTIEI